MKVFRDIESLRGTCQGGTVMSIGMFDGVHRGHQMLIAAARERAESMGLTSLIFTFPRHPLALLAPPYAPPMLSDPEHKLALIERFGAEMCLMLDFTPEFSTIEAEEFIERIVVGACQARHIVCGPDFRFGRGGRGNDAMLEELGRRLGFTVEIREPLMEGHTAIKSTRVRQCLIEGRIEEAHLLLGHPYLLTGLVTKGDGRGRQIGYPTANIEPPAGRLVPGDGVYAVRIRRGQDHWGAMMNIGTRPTFYTGDQSPRTIEAYLFDFSGDLYGEELTLSFVARVREERKFDSLDALLRQLQADQATCRALLQE